MTTTLERTTDIPVLPVDGQMGCDMCGTIYRHAIVLGSPITPREQMRQAASRDGWKLTFDGRDVCASDAEGGAAFLIRGWTDFWSPEKALVPLQAGPPEPENSDDAQTATIPAVVEQDETPAPAGRHPYDPQRGAA